MNFIACHLDVGAAEDELAQSKQHQAEALDVLNTALGEIGLTEKQAEAVAQAILLSEEPARPSLSAIEAVTLVMGDRSMNVLEVLKALEAGTLTPASQDPRTYISFILSQNKDRFERDPSAGVGYYRVITSDWTVALS